MDKPCKFSDDTKDPDFFDNIKAKIEKELSNMKKIVNSINQMRVDAAYFESDLMMTIDASTWEDISELIGITSMNIIDVSFKDGV